MWIVYELPKDKIWYLIHSFMITVKLKSNPSKNNFSHKICDVKIATFNDESKSYSSWSSQANCKNSSGADEENSREHSWCTPLAARVFLNFQVLRNVHSRSTSLSSILIIFHHETRWFWSTSATNTEASKILCQPQKMFPVSTLERFAEVHFVIFRFAIFVRRFYMKITQRSIVVW